MGYTIGDKQVAQTLVRAGREKPWEDRHGSARITEPVGIFMRTQIVELDETAYAERETGDSSENPTEHTPARCLRRKWDDDHHLVEDEGTLDAYNIEQTDLPQGIQVVCTTDTRNQNLLLAIPPSEVFGVLADDWSGGSSAEITLTDGFLVNGKGTLIAKAAPTLPESLPEGTAVTCRFVKAKNDWFFFRPAGASGPTKVFFENVANTTLLQFYDGRVICPLGQPINLPVQGMYDIIRTENLHFNPGEYELSSIFYYYQNQWIMADRWWTQPPTGRPGSGSTNNEERTFYYGRDVTVPVLDYPLVCWENPEYQLTIDTITTGMDGTESTETHTQITTIPVCCIDGYTFAANEYFIKNRDTIEFQEIHTRVGVRREISDYTLEDEGIRTTTAKMLPLLWYESDGRPYNLRGAVRNAFTPANVLEPNHETPAIRYYLETQLGYGNLRVDGVYYYPYMAESADRCVVEQTNLERDIQRFEQYGRSDTEIAEIFARYGNWQFRPSSPQEHGSYYLLPDETDTNGLKFNRNLTYRFYCLSRRVIDLKDYLTNPGDFRIVKRDGIYILDKNGVLGNELPDDLLNRRCAYGKTPDLNTQARVTEDDLEDFFTFRDAFDGTVEPNEAGSYMSHPNGDGETCDLFLEFPNAGGWYRAELDYPNTEVILRKGQPIVKRDDVTLTVQTGSSDWHEAGMLIKAYIYDIPERELDA